MLGDDELLFFGAAAAVFLRSRGQRAPTGVSVVM